MYNKPKSGSKGVEELIKPHYQTHLQLVFHVFHGYLLPYPLQLWSLSYYMIQTNNFLRYAGLMWSLFLIMLLHLSGIWQGL